MLIIIFLAVIMTISNLLFDNSIMCIDIMSNQKTESVKCSVLSVSYAFSILLEESIKIIIQLIPQTELEFEK